jgi:hypothetical protein
MRTKIIQILFLLAVVSALARPVAAGEYQLILGKGTEVCEACLKNLQQQPVEEAVCDRQYDPVIGLHSAKWTELDLREHAELLKRINSLVNSGNESAHSTFDNPKTLKEYVEGGTVRNRLPTMVMAIADIDIDNDGQPDNVLRYEQGKCRNMFGGWQYFYESVLLKLADDRSTIDYARTDPLIQHISKGPQYLVGIPDFQIYQVFTHKGTVYFDKWNGGGDKEDPITLKLDQPDVNTLSVYRVNKNQTNKICRIRLFPADIEPHN